MKNVIFFMTYVCEGMSGDRISLIRDIKPEDDVFEGFFEWLKVKRNELEEMSKKPVVITNCKIIR